MGSKCIRPSTGRGEIVMLKTIFFIARAALVLSTLIDLIGLIWFAGTYSAFVAISGALTVAGGFAVAFIPEKVIQKRKNNVFYKILLFVAIVTTVVLMIAVDVNDEQVLDVAMYRVLHVVLLAVIGWSVLKNQKVAEPEKILSHN